jgi:hypothetical protein
MHYTIKNPSTLRKLLWADTILGGGTAIIGLLFFNTLSDLLGFTTIFIIVVSVVTLLYAIVAFILANQKSVSIPLLRLLVQANWFWTAVSIVLLFLHYSSAKALGIAFLILQILVVGGLAYLEGKQIVKKPLLR